MNFNQLVNILVEEKTLKLILIRGISGSGKTTYAKKLMNEDPSLSHYEADMYFLDQNGKYNFDPKKLPEAHAWCINETENDLSNNKSVIVSNTFTTKWEIQKYIDLGEKYGATVVIKKATGKYKNLHGVPEEAIKKMQSRWETIHGEEAI